jgi:hypothetical protein
MGESGLVFMVVPVAYGIAFFLLLLGAVIVTFVRSWQFLSAYFVSAALATIPAFILWIPCVNCCEKLVILIENRNLLAGGSLVLTLMISTIAAAIVSFVTAVFISAKVVYRTRHHRPDVRQRAS